MRALRDAHWLWLLAGCVLLWAGGRLTVRGLARDARFLVSPGHIEVKGPAWGRDEVVAPALRRLQQLGPLSLFDAGFEARVRAALGEVPGVARVGRIRRHWPARYAVEVMLHRPAAVVRYGARRVPVTAGAATLPEAPYATASRGLLHIVGVDRAPPPAGATWRSEALADALATVDQLTPQLQRLAPLGLTRIDVSRARDPRRGVVLHGADGITVRWGRPRATVGENAVSSKLLYLRIAAAHVERVRGFEIDVRYGALYLRESSVQ
jgi:hypothetical protein